MVATRGWFAKKNRAPRRWPVYSKRIEFRLMGDEIRTENFTARQFRRLKYRMLAGAVK